jgi:Ca2+-binding EF-hand superfamily protein
MKVRWNSSMKILYLLALSIFALNAQEARRNIILTVPLLAALDTNHDGVISAEEINNAGVSLKTLDVNHDGKLTAVECGMKGGLETLGPSPDELVDALMAFDRNHDGKLERSEVPERMQGLFDRADTDKKGVLTPSQIRKVAEDDNEKRADPEPFPGYAKRSRIAYMHRFPVNNALDANHDGEVSVSEIENAPAALRTLDKNGDGQLTEDEVTADPVAALVIQFMLAADTNGDGRLSKGEWSVRSAQEFITAIEAADVKHHGYVTEAELIAEIRNRADSNHDGIVTAEELQQARRSGALGVAPPLRQK